MGDVAVIGAGIAGLAAAGELAARGLRPVVFDSGRTEICPPFRSLAYFFETSCAVVWAGFLS